VEIRPISSNPTLAPRKVPQTVGTVQRRHDGAPVEMFDRNAVLIDPDIHRTVADAEKRKGTVPTPADCVRRESARVSRNSQTEADRPPRGYRSGRN